MKRWTKVLAWVAGVLVCLVAAAWVFLFSPLEATGPCGRCGVADTGDVEVAANGTTGLIVYTGARVVPEAYAPITELIGEAGFPVFIPRLTLNFAVFDAQAADSVIREHPEIERWVIAGHSLGGVMAARYAADHAEIDGLVFWASYPDGSIDLSESGLVVSSIYGSRDTLSTPDEVLASKGRLPEGTMFVVVDGGNHAQFGRYGEQRGDQPATIPPEAQWSQVAEATIAVLEAVAGGGS